VSETNKFAILDGIVRTAQDAEDVASAAVNRAKQLRSLAEECLKKGKEKEASAWKVEADGFEEELKKPWYESRTWPVVRAMHVVGLVKGLEAHVTRLRKLPNQVRDCGLTRYAESLDAFEGHADHVERGLLAKLKEQTELELPPAPSPTITEGDTTGSVVLLDDKVESGYLDDKVESGYTPEDESPAVP
jgi:hypothetical protein